MSVVLLPRVEGTRQGVDLRLLPEDSSGSQTRQRARTCRVLVLCRARLKGSHEDLAGRSLGGVRMLK